MLILFSPIKLYLKFYTFSSLYPSYFKSTYFLFSYSIFQQYIHQITYSIFLNLSNLLCHCSYLLFTFFLYFSTNIIIFNNFILIYQIFQYSIISYLFLIFLNVPIYFIQTYLLFLFSYPIISFLH